MKKIIIFPLLLVGLVSSKTADLPLADVFQSPSAFFKGLAQAGSLYFKGANPRDYEIRKIGDPLFEDSVFKYDLNLQFIQSKHTPSNTTTIYFHGWGDTKNSALIWKEFFKVIDNSIICFNFSDAQPIIGKLHKTSFGQLNDMLPAIYALKRAIEILHLESINIFCVSRGCATLINVLALLNDDQLFNKHKPALSLIGVGQREREKILSAIQKGTIIFDVPLRSMKLTPFPQVIAKHLTLHNEHIWDPMEMVHKLNGLKLTTLIHYQYGDAIVSNTKESEFFSILASHNPQSTYLVMGNDGGHIHSHRALHQAIPIFKELHFNQQKSHEKLRIVDRKSIWINNGQLVNFMRPTPARVKKILENYYYNESKSSFGPASIAYHEEDLP